MSFTVNNSAANTTTGGTSVSVSISIPTGHSVGVIARSTNAGTLSVTGNNAYTIGNTVIGSFSDQLKSFYSLGIGSSETAIVLNSTASEFLSFVVWDITATGTIAYADSEGQCYVFNNPSTTDGVTTGSMTLTSADGLLISAGWDPGGGTLTIGTGFTADATALAMVSEHKAVTASAAATWTDNTANSRPVVMGLAFQVSGGGGGNTASIAWIT
jgi:hypothetical protein